MSLDWDPACSECNRRHMQLMWRQGDLGSLRRKAHRMAAPDHGFADRLAAAKSDVEDAEARFEEHLAEVHPDGIEGPERVVKPKREPKPIPEGKVRCEACGKVVTVLGVRLRRHKDSSGFPCVNMRAPGAELHLSDAPPVNLPPEPKWRPATRARATAAPRREEGEPARLEAGSSCRECGKWLPGERSLCGRCSVLQGRAS